MSAKKEAAAAVTQPVTEQDNITYLPVDKIASNPKNPREFGKYVLDADASDAFAELIASIKEHGVLQPIIVRERINLNGPESYELVAGERRWRAATVAGLATIPAIVKDLTDDQAFDIMTIENLQREDLTEAEEARSFKAYVDTKGPAAIEDLAQRSGISARYIRRRVQVMELPAQILKEWEDGKIAFGVLEQLLRLDPNKVERFYKEQMRSEWDRKIDRVKDTIDRMAIPLGHALFKMKAAGCGSCQNNSQVQVSLFGDDFLGNKASCLNSACFIENQRKHLTENWAKTAYAKKNGTNGFIFHDQSNWNDYQDLFKPVHKDCETCPSYVTILYFDGKTSNNKACSNLPCLRDKTRPPKSSTRNTGTSNPGHGTLFREAFYSQRVPEVVRTQYAPDDEKILRLTLAALIRSNDSIEHRFTEKVMNIKEERYSYTPFESIWLKIQHMTAEELKDAIREASIAGYFHQYMGSETHHLIASHLGIDLSREWLLHEEYLQEKTIPEILTLGKDLNIFSDEKAVAYLAESLKKKSVAACKKKDLIKLILESGVDLAGKVPKEILTTGKEH